MENMIDKNVNQNQPKKYDSDFLSRLVTRTVNMKCEDIIKEHRSLIDYKDEAYDYVGDYEKRFIFMLLNHDFGYWNPKETPEELEKFFNSKYLGDYFKKIIQEELEEAMIEVPKIITSDTDVSEFTEEDFYEIESAYNQQGPSNRVFDLTFRLNTEGARKYLMNKVEPMKLIRNIILRSGLNSRPEYYSGRGATMCDLSGKHLISIYKKLLKLDPNKALNMAKMTLHMPTLGTTEFLESLYNLVENNYIFEEANISTNNLSLGSAREEERESAAIGCITSFLRGSMPDDTVSIKAQFINLLPQEIAIEAYDDKIGHIFNPYDKWGKVLYGEYRRTRKK